MQKTVLTKALTIALATLGAGAAFAQTSTLTLYGNADVAFDNVNRQAGGTNASGAVVTALTAGKAYDAVHVTRVSPSATSQTSFGFKGTEDIGGGLMGTFVLEGQLSHDTGALSQDGRIFGRQSYVGLTTPVGEIRLGRQYAPIFYSTAFVTTEKFGATDLFIEGGASNNLQVRQDNQISYWAKVGNFTGEVSYSPNAGSDAAINSTRGAAVTSSSGQILGGASAGTEQPTKRGRAYGAFGAYMDSALTVTAGFHRNEFAGATSGVFGGALSDYTAVNLGGKYTLTGGAILSAVVGQGTYDVSSTALQDPKLRFMAAGARVPFGAVSVIAQVSQVKFTNFTQGKDTGVMLGAEYALSKRTTLYSRLGQIKDDRGNATAIGAAGSVDGGPDFLLTAGGFRETPLFAGVGITAGGKTTYAGAGIRHTF